MYPMAWYWQIQELEREAHSEDIAAERLANDVLRAAHENWAQAEEAKLGGHTSPALTMRRLWPSIGQKLKRALRVFGGKSQRLT